MGVSLRIFYFMFYVQKAEETKLEPLGKPKKAVKKKKDDYDLPEIPDYERPVLEKYDKSDFDPTKKEKVRMVFIFVFFLVPKISRAS